MNISKKVFIECIEKMQSASKFQEDLNKIYKKHGANGYYWWDDCSSAVLILLQEIFKDSPYVDYIEDFCYEYNFGKTVKEKSFKDNDGQYMDLSTIDKLYDMLCKTSEGVIDCQNMD